MDQNWTRYLFLLTRKYKLCFCGDEKWEESERNSASLIRNSNQYRNNSTFRTGSHIFVGLTKWLTPDYFLSDVIISPVTAALFSQLVRITPNISHPWVSCWQSVSNLFLRSVTCVLSRSLVISVCLCWYLRWPVQCLAAVIVVVVVVCR